MSSKKKGKDDLKDFIVDDDYISHEDSDYEEEDEFNEDDFYLPKKKRRASEGDIGEYKKRKHFKDLYFMKLSKNEQSLILKKENEIYSYFNLNTPLRYTIINSNLSMSTKSLIIHKLDQFDKMNSEENEYQKLYKWINSLAKIPFNNYAKLTIELKPSKIQAFLVESYQTLDKTIYGQFNAKNKIMQILAQWISNPESMGQIIACHGPAGVGKTSLIKEGVSKVLNKPFCFYALGGANDISILEGHSYTYEGATCGRLVEMLMESKVMNPIIFFDELDKISSDEKGNNIENLMIHLTDPSQNMNIQDKYFSGIELDFSKSLLFFSFNHIEKINPILKDRLTIVKFDGYEIDEKIVILKDYLLKQMITNVGLNSEDVIFDDTIIKYIIEKYSSNEEGMRDTKRVFEELLLKINLLKLLFRKNKQKNNELKKEMNIDYMIDNLSFPLHLSKKDIDIFLKNYKQ